MNSPEAVRARLAKYLIPVMIIAIVFNVPKFLEAEIKFVAIEPNSTVKLTYHNLSVEDKAMFYDLDWRPKVSVKKS